MCWGQNHNGDLGTGTTEGGPSPVQVVGLSDAVALDVGGSQACVIRAGGVVACWGGVPCSGGCTLGGILGDGSTGGSATPVQVVGIRDAVAVSVGTQYLNFACALRERGQVVCWGYNQYGQLGDGTTEDRTTPVPIAWP